MGNNTIENELRLKKDRIRLKAILSDREYSRMIKREKREATLKAGGQVFDDLTGRTYFQRGIDEPAEFRNMGSHFKQHRERMKNASING